MTANNLTEDLSLAYEQLNAIFQGSGDGMRVINADFTIVTANNEMSRLCGIPVAETMGMKCFDQFCGEHCFVETCTLIRVLRGAKRIKVETLKKSLNGRKIWVEMVASPLMQGGQIVGVIEAFRDISQRKKDEKALSLARRQAEAADKAKTEFLANMSHELRTPLNAIIGFTDIMGESELTPYQADCLSMIRGSSESLHVLVNNILDCSKFSAGQLILQQSNFHPKQLVSDVCALMRHKVGNKPITITCQSSGLLPDVAIGDEGRLRQVLINLLDNATKFTTSGHIALTLDLEEDVDNRLKMHLAVQDSGIGIQADKLSCIFEPFYQVDGSTTRKYGGAGLGLAICKYVARLSGGEVWAESEGGEGSIFHFTFWCGKVAREGTNKARQSTNSVRQQKTKGLAATEKTCPAAMRILLVEDNLVNQKVAKALLHKAGHHVTLANNGLEAVDIFIASPSDFDLILMDIQMPIMDGFEATRQIRDKGFTTVPIVAVSANAIKGDRQRCLKVGMNAYVTKPITNESIVSIIQTLN